MSFLAAKQKNCPDAQNKQIFEIKTTRSDGTLNEFF